MKIMVGLNAVTFGFLLSLVFIEGLPREYWEQAVFLLITFLPLVNALYILKTKILDENVSSRNWLSLYLKRKRLEEEKRIADLKDK